ncbi:MULTISPECIES: response regulator [unclassified Azospirillum]|uniref:response regulator n=1 Tax=unclassified Azospirillum TaxID=2630922 RepID=UPI000D65DA2A|nr:MULTISPECIES: response regulator [unclassified Azospirillum]
MRTQNKKAVQNSSDRNLVLLIENSMCLRIAMKTLIEMWGYDVLDASSARQTFTALREVQKRPDVMISDHHPLEKESGIDSIRAIRALSNKRLPAILLINDFAFRDDILTAEEINVLRKPVDPHQLRALLATMTII